MEIEVIEGKLKDIIVEIKNHEVTADSITVSSNLLTQMGIDSLQLINLILSIEDEFSLELDFDNFDLAQLENFGSLCRFIADCIDKKSNNERATDDLLLKLSGNENKA